MQRIVLIRLYLKQIRYSEANKLIQIDNSKKENLSSLEERFQSKRNIRLTRRSGEIIRVDIPKYYATRDAQYNQMLRGGDEVFSPH